MLKRIVIGVCGASLLGLGLFSLYAWNSSIDPVTPPLTKDYSPEVIAQGKILASAGYCSTCHTPPGGQEYAGNYEMHTEFGTIYSSNITPDVKTGIGSWSEEAFMRAMRTGVSRDGHHLLPAFPYEHFNKMSDQDINAIYAYIMTSIPAVEQVKKDNGIPFPLNIRALQAGWKLLFADTGQFVKDSAQSEQWNRGAYLAEGVAHCGACHTPRNALGGEKYDEMYQGAAIDGWIAPSLTETSTSPIPWRAQDFYEYLTTGNSPYHGSAAGPMAPVMHKGLSALPDSDIEAISVYFAANNGTDQSIDPSTSESLKSAIAAQHKQADLRIDEGARLYATTCQACHYSSETIVKGRPLITLGSSTHLDKPTNLVNIMLDGVRSDQGIHGVVMPGFRNALSDQDIASIAAYLRQAAGEESWPKLLEQVGEIRNQPRFEH
ncbi:c-type cytochrome [Psychromonas sp. 14N.309.X.WAT.B.A12]|uniref:c-type cytochrome n=1 Tax=unclassified Psychromonas TaxID=2614957 RepID=UPI0025AFC9CA|nr:cytochrome c [Psychromonas sp. 14N.309.X.WAT.B.A12]MDN2661907.1 cytochrome c [Psychromonas sp. 14N.309.X.WAT.B.A12]